MDESTRPEHDAHTERHDDEQARKRPRYAAPFVPTNAQLRERTTILLPGMNVYLRLPSGMMKLVTLEKGSTISIGKFGSFEADHIIGKPFGPTYEIKPDGSLDIMHQAVAEALVESLSLIHI